MRQTPRHEDDKRREAPPAKDESHPVATGIGAGAAGLAGAAAGTVLAGPAGTLVGAAVAGIAGGVAGNKVGELVNPAEEEAYWRENFRNEPYYARGRDWDHYAGAYRAGYEGRVRYDGRAYDDVEDILAADYARFQGSGPAWDDVRPATRAAWERVDRRIQDATRN